MDLDIELAERIASQEGCRSTTRLEEALEDPNVDAVVISSVTHSHYNYCKASLLARKAVFTEKPISHTPGELKEIVDLAVSSRRPFIVGVFESHP